MFTKRSLRSIAQFLELQDRHLVKLLLEKHGLRGVDAGSAGFLSDLAAALDHGSSASTSAVLGEVARTSGDLRSRVSPRYRYDERLSGLRQCLLLDGYFLDENGALPLDPSIKDAEPLEDDLSRELASCGLASASTVTQKLNDSTASFRAATPNYNASLNDARVALQTLATDIARVRVTTHPGPFDDAKWGSVVAHLRSTMFITDEEERGLIGVFGFVSPGSHRPIGISEAEFTRLGRAFVAGMCWFLVKRHRALA